MVDHLAQALLLLFTAFLYLGSGALLTDTERVGRVAAVWLAGSAVAVGLEVESRSVVVPTLLVLASLALVVGMLRWVPRLGTRFVAGFPVLLGASAALLAPSIARQRSWSVPVALLAATLLTVTGGVAYRSSRSIRREVAAGLLLLGR